MSPSPLLLALERLADGADLSAEQAHSAVDTIMAGRAPEGLIAAFLTALRVKGETAEELTGAVLAVRERMDVFDGPFPPLLDTCGTGGDGACTINVSTVTALLAAACGVPVAKHGNRSASGNCGSAEVLTELGVVVEAEPAVLRRCLLELGITFLHAPRFHPALRYASPARRLLPFRTLFNLVGPLANPARPAYQLVGAPGERQAELIAETIRQSGVQCAAVVTGADGLDEVSLGGATHVLWIEKGEIASRIWYPVDFGLTRVSADALRVGGPADSADRVRRLLDGEAGPVRGVVLANAAAALLVAGRVGDLREGVTLAAEAIDSRKAVGLLARWGRLSRRESEVTMGMG